ncbi:MAG: lipopolysaccharide biosynthesis protein [Patescibacteria group bacterium]
MEQISTLQKSIEGGKWTFINTVFKNLINFASFLILARFLAPADFGLFTIIFIVPNFMTLVATTGLETALIQKKEDPIPYLNPLWTLGVLKALAIFLIIFFFAPLIADFFNIRQAMTAVRLSGLAVLIGGLSNSAQLFFFKNIDFKKIFIRDIAGSLAYGAIALTLAVFYKSFWPLFWGVVAQSASSTASTYFLHKFRPRFSFQFQKFLSLINYSKWIYGQNLVDRIAPTIENSLIAKMTGAEKTGLFTKAKSVSSVPIAPFYNIIDRVAFPSYARIQNSYEKIRDGFVKSLDVLFFLSVPVAFLFIEASHRLILIFLGEKWIGMNTLLKIISASFAVSAFSSGALPIFNAVGKPKIRFWIMLINLSALSIFLFALIPVYGILGAAITILITDIIVSLVAVIMLIKTIAFKLTDAIKSPLIPVIASLIVLAAGRTALKYLEPVADATFIILIIFLSALYLIITMLAGKFLRLGPYATLKLIVSETVFSFKNKNFVTEKISE